VSDCGLDRLSSGLCLGPTRRKREKKGQESVVGTLIADIDRYFPATAATIANRELPTAETVQHFLDRRKVPSMASRRRALGIS